MGDFIQLGEDGFREHSHRIFELGGEWYFKTRYGIEGPFQDQMQVEQKLSAHLEIFENLELSQVNTTVHPAHTQYNVLEPRQVQWRWR